jgi:hypothetical protein
MNRNCFGSCVEELNSKIVYLVVILHLALF